MKNKWKKLLGVVLALALIVGLTPGAGTTANAESDGAINIGSSDASGTHWSYVASTHTLTLNGYNYNGYDDGVTYSGSDPLTISLIGTNSITTSKNDGHGICCRSNGTALRISGEGSLDVSATANVSPQYGAGIYFVGDIEFAGGTVRTSGTWGIYNHDHHVTVSGGEVYATGTNCGVYTKNGGMLYITGGKLVATGNSQAIAQDGSSYTRNSIAGTGWTNTEGTEGETAIPINTDGEQKLTYKKVQFPADPVASVTSGGTTTEYTAFPTRSPRGTTRPMMQRSSCSPT